MCTKIRFEDDDDPLDICRDKVFKAVFARGTAEEELTPRHKDPRKKAEDNLHNDKNGKANEELRNEMDFLTLSTYYFLLLKYSLFFLPLSFPSPLCRHAGLPPLFFNVFCVFV